MSFGPMTGSLPTIIRNEIPMNLIVSGDKIVKIDTTFDYAAHEPFSVRASFITVDGAIEWVLSRDLLAQALTEPAGDGDVSAWVEGTGSTAVFCLQLTSPNGQALLETDASLIQDFLDRSYLTVPAGAESNMLNMDSLIAQLLDKEGPANIA